MSVRRHLIGIVDDDPHLLVSLGDLLESVGYEVCAFSSAEVLLADTRFPDVDCLITDIGMPGRNGLELQRIANNMNPELPVLFITGRYELVSELRPANFDLERLFLKPFDSHLLLAAVADALKRPV